MFVLNFVNDDYISLADTILVHLTEESQAVDHQPSNCVMNCIEEVKESVVLSIAF